MSAPWSPTELDEVLDEAPDHRPPLVALTVEPVEPPSDLPERLAVAVAEQPQPEKRSQQHYAMVATAVACGLSDGEVAALARSHAPSVQKWGLDGAHRAAEVSLAKLRPEHRHAGRACAEAGCPNRPRWMPSLSEETAIDAEVIDVVSTELGITGPAAWKVAERVVARREHEQVIRLARRLVGEAELLRATDFDAIEGATALELLRKQRPTKVPALGNLVHEGHNVTITARYKTGKSTLAENMVRAFVSGGRFLGRFQVSEPINVVYLNFELTPEDMDDRIRQMALPEEQQARLWVENLRGHTVPLMTRLGREWLVRICVNHGTGGIVVDPFGAAFASAGGQNENDNAEARRFVTALDEIKRLAGVRTLAMPHHTGRGEQLEGEEHGRGNTTLDDWADVRMILTKDADGSRFLRTEGRAVDLPESRLEFEEATGLLYLPTGDIGVNRRLARHHAGAEAVVRIVQDRPGINKTDLNAALAAEGVTNNDDKQAAVNTALLTKRIHAHEGLRTAKHHFGGAAHLDPEPCPGGNR